MEIRVLRYFLTVVREENVTRAAEILHITQPTLSRQIAQMEEEMGVRLFDRSTRRMTLTQEGMLLRRRAEEILALVDKTERELTEQQEKIEGIVSIGCGDLAAVQRLAGLLEEFHQYYPRVSFDLYTATADHIKDRMDHGLADAGLLLEPVSVERYEYVRMPRQEQWVAVMHPESPLASLPFVTPADLREVPLILPHRGDVRNELASWFGEEFDHLHVLFTANLPSNSAVMVQHRLACLISVLGSTSFWDQKKITWRPLSPQLQTGCVLAWKRNQPFSSAAKTFLQFARQRLRREQTTETPV